MARQGPSSKYKSRKRNPEAAQYPLQNIAQHMHKGGLHESLGIPQDQKIPAARIEAATHSSNPKTRKQANLAQTFAKHRGGS